MAVFTMSLTYGELVALHRLICVCLTIQAALSVWLLLKSESFMRNEGEFRSVAGGAMVDWVPFYLRAGVPMLWLAQAVTSRLRSKLAHDSILRDHNNVFYSLAIKAVALLGLVNVAASIAFAAIVLFTKSIGGTA